MSASRLSSLDLGDLSVFDARAAALQDPRPHPTGEALDQLGAAILGETLDLVLDTALEDYLAIIAETLIGGLHAGAQRLQREADRARDELSRQLRDFDGSEVADTDLQAAKQKAEAGDVAVMALEQIRDAASAIYTTATGEVWSPWRGSVRAGKATAAQIEARDALKAQRARKQAGEDPGDQVVAFRASPKANTAEDAQRIFDALNWARTQWPDMVLATTGAPGAEQIAKRWAAQKGVRIVLARADFDRHGRGAPFRANEELLALEPVCVLTLAQSLNAARADGLHPFGPAQSLAQEGAARGLRCLRISPRPL